MEELLQSRILGPIFTEIQVGSSKETKGKKTLFRKADSFPLLLRETQKVSDALPTELRRRNSEKGQILST